MSIENVHIKQLYILQSLIETNSVTETGKRLKLNQSTVSNVLRKLRKDLNNELFYKNGRELKATEYTIKIEESINLFLKKITNIDKTEIFNPNSGKHNFTIIVMEHFTLINFEKLILAFSKYKNINIRYLTPHYKTDDFNRYIEKNEIDCCIESINIPNGHNAMDITYEDRVLLYNPKNAAIHSNLTKSEYMNLNHVGLNFDQEILKQIPKIFNITKDTRNILRVDGLLTIFSIIERLPSYVSIVGKCLAEQYAMKFGLKYQNPPITLEPIKGYLSWPKTKERDAKNLWIRNKILEAYYNGN